MAEEREKVNITAAGGTLTTKPSADERTNADIVAQAKARFVQIRDRGFTTDRIDVRLPSHLHGEWVPNDAQSIQQYKDLGFEIDTQYAAKHGLNSNGDSGSVFGDTVFMTCPRELKNVFDEVTRDRYRNTYERRRDGTFLSDNQFKKEAANSDLEVLDPSVRTQERVVQGGAIAESVTK